MSVQRIAGDWQRLPDGLRVQFIYDLDTNAMTCDWAPRPPKNRTEFNRVADKYRELRNAFMLEIAPDKSILVLE